MSSVERLKIINSESSRSLEELLVNCQNVNIVSDSQNSLILVGYWENKLCIVPALTPTASQVHNIICLHNYFYLSIYIFN